MKNQFNKITQGIFETFKGPRTQDIEYDKMLQEYQICKERMLSLKSIISSYPKRLEGYKTTLDELISHFETIFDKEQTIYYKYMSDVKGAHKALSEKLNNMFLRVEGMNETMEKWNKNCKTVDEKIKLREEKRKTFDHYDEKMGELYEDRSKDFSKGEMPSEKDEEKFWRNVKKYQDSSKEYVASTNDAYKFMCYLLDSRYENISISIAEFLDIELTFFTEATNIFNYFKNIKNNVLAIKQSFKQRNITYDAANFIRGKDLLNKSIQELKLSDTYITGIIEGTPSEKSQNNINNLNNTNNGMNKSNAFNQNQYSMMNSNLSQGTLYNPYNNSMSVTPSYNYGNPNIDNSIPDPFNNNNNNSNFINPYNQNISHPQQKNPYSQGNTFSGENPFDKPNI